MKGQWFNLPAIQILGHVLKSPSLLIPHFHVQTVADIDTKNLKSYGFKYIVLDKDNTISAPYSKQLFSKEIENWKMEAMNTFGKENVAIFSNSLGFVDNTASFEGINIIQHQKIQKPKGIIEVKNHFGNSSTIDSKDIIMVGDRYFTDIVFGNLNGMCTIYTQPLTNRGENNMVKLVSLIFFN